MNAFTPVAPKLVKLIPLLGSDKSGEVVAAAAAMSRTLKAAGLDWHAVASAVEAAPEIKIIESAAPQRREPATWGEVARWCRDHGDRLADHERRFVRDMAARLVCGGEPTERQAAWLRAIYAKLRAA